MNQQQNLEDRAELSAFIGDLLGGRVMLQEELRMARKEHERMMAAIRILTIAVFFLLALVFSMLQVSDGVAFALCAAAAIVSGVWRLSEMKPRVGGDRL